MNMANKNKLAIAVIGALLSSCASLPQAPATVAAAPVVVAPAPAPAQAAAEPLPSAAEGVTDNGINRVGRVLQLGRVPEVAPALPDISNDSVELNYEQEDLRRVIEQLGNVLGINMLIDPTIDSKVSLRTSPGAPMRYADIWPLLRLLARNAGVTIEQAGAVWEFKLNAATVPVELVTPDALAASTASTVLQVTPLTHLSVEAAETVIMPLLQPEGSVIRLGPANLLGISGTPGQLRRINELLAVLDDDPFQNQGIQLYELLNSRAADVAEELTSLLTLIEGEQPAYQVLGLDRINAVLVVAPAARGFEEVTRWVQILDAESQEQVEQLFVFRVKNLKALTLAETLSKVFVEAEDEAAQQAAPAQQDRSTAAGPLSMVQGLGPNGGVFTLAQSALGALDAGVADQPSGTASATSANITVTIVADEETNSLLIRATPREYRQLLATLSNMDRITPQVLIHAVIGQVTLTEGTRFGIDWARVSGSLSSGPARISSRLLPSSLYDAAGNVAAGPGSGLILTRSFTDGSAVIDATLHAIAEDNDVTLLARPTILATNNKEGSIHVGQSVPVNNGSTVGVGGTQNFNISYQNVGIDLKITPQISDDGYVNLQIEQALSSVEEGSTGVAGNPTFTDQNITTSVVVSNESTITLGGLIQEEESDQQNGIPGLVKIPGVGRLFAYTNQQTTRRELFVILRPQIIRGDERDDSVLREYRDSFTHVSALLREAGL
jgi:general secretion pathway protein D